MKVCSQVVSVKSFIDSAANFFGMLKWFKTRREKTVLMTNIKAANMKKIQQGNLQRKRAGDDSSARNGLGAGFLVSYAQSL